MLEPNSCVFRASAAWKYPFVWERLKKDTASRTGLFTSAGTLTNSMSISGLHKKGKHPHNYTHLPQAALLFQLSLRAISTLCQGAGTVHCQLWEFQRFGGSEHSSLLLSESYCWSALTWKEICKKAIILQVEKHLQFKVEAGGYWWRKIWRKWIQGTKFYFLEFPDFYSEDIVYWFWIKSE